MTALQAAKPAPQKQSIFSKVQKVTEVSPYLKACFYGPEGSGKTSLAATAPKPLFFALEPGMESLKNPNNPAYGRDVDVLHITDVEDLILAIGELQHDLQGYETFVIDTMTALEARRISSQLVRNYLADRKRNLYLASQADYKEKNEVLRRIIISLCDLPANVIILAHDRSDKDDTTGAISTGPNVGKKIQDVLAEQMSLLAYMVGTTSGENGEEFNIHMRTRPGNGFRAKTRINLPTLITNPTIEMIMQARKEGLESE